MKKNKGQEAIEFALITALVFLVGLFVTLTLGKNLVGFFTGENSTVNVAADASNAATRTNFSNFGNAGSTSITASTQISVDIGGGNSLSLDIPDTSYYVGNTTGASGTLESIQNASNLSDALSDSLATLANATNNKNLDTLVSLMSSTAELESGFINYDTSLSPDWYNNLDPSSPTFAAEVAAIVDGLDKSLKQMQDESYVGGQWSNSITGMAAQDDFAAQLSQAIVDVQNDSTLSDDVKQVASMLTGQVQAIADNHDYVVNATTYNDALPVLTKIDPTIATLSPVPQPAASNTITASGGNVSANVILAAVSTPSAQASIDTLTIEEKQTLSDLLKSIQIDVVQPMDNVINTTLAVQTACLIGGSSWNAQTNQCS